MRYLLLALLLVLAFAGCTSNQQPEEAVPTEEAAPTGEATQAAYRIVGATVPALTGPGWRVIAAEDSLVLFEKASDTGVLGMRVAMHLMPLRLSEADVHTAMEADRERQIDTTRFDVLSIHFNSIQLQGVPCVQYDYVLKDRTADASNSSQFDHTTIYGHMCYTSSEEGQAVEMEWSYRSRSRKAPEQILTEGKRFVEAVQLEATDS